MPDGSIAAPRCSWSIPIDGTRAFIGGRDTWCVSAAVVHEGRPRRVAVLVAPSLAEDCSRQPDGGVALKNGEPI
jgi:myo-inositol-1(or 4)-monophosphatase